MIPPKTDNETEVMKLLKMFENGRRKLQILLFNKIGQNITNERCALIWATFKSEKGNIQI